MRSSDLMSTAVQVLTCDEPVCRAAEMMRDFDVGIVPVVENRSDMQLVGVITDRDIVVRCVAAGTEPAQAVRDCMTTALVTTTGDTDIHELLHRMGQAQVRRMPVVDEDDRLIGIVSMADVLLALGPKEPLHVERAIEMISSPAYAEL